MFVAAAAAVAISRAEGVEGLRLKYRMYSDEALPVHGRRPVFGSSLAPSDELYGSTRSRPFRHVRMNPNSRSGRLIYNDVENENSHAEESRWNSVPNSYFTANRFRRALHDRVDARVNAYAYDREPAPAPQYYSDEDDYERPGFGRSTTASSSLRTRPQSARAPRADGADVFSRLNAPRTQTRRTTCGGLVNGTLPPGGITRGSREGIRGTSTIGN